MNKMEFSGATIVIFIALGALVLVLLFIFAKRQIMRFTLRSRRGPHIPVGHSAPKVPDYLYDCWPFSSIDTYYYL